MGQADQPSPLYRSRLSYLHKHGLFQHRPGARRVLHNADISQWLIFLFIGLHSSRIFSLRA